MKTTLALIAELLSQRIAEAPQARDLKESDKEVLMSACLGENVSFLVTAAFCVET